MPSPGLPPTRSPSFAECLGAQISCGACPAPAAESSGCDWIALYLNQKGAPPRNAQELIAFARHRGGALLYRDARRAVFQAGIGAEAQPAVAHTDALGRSLADISDENAAASRARKRSASLGVPSRRAPAREERRIEVGPPPFLRNAQKQKQDSTVDVMLSAHWEQIFQSLNREKAERVSLSMRVDELLASDGRVRDEVERLSALVEREIRKRRSLATKWSDLTKEVHKALGCAATAPRHGESVAIAKGDDEASDLFYPCNAACVRPPAGEGDSHEADDSVDSFRNEIRGELSRIESLTTSLGQKVENLVTFTWNAEEMRASLANDVAHVVKTVASSGERASCLGTDVSQVYERLKAAGDVRPPAELREVSVEPASCCENSLPPRRSERYGPPESSRIEANCDAVHGGPTSHSVPRTSLRRVSLVGMRRHASPKRSRAPD
uniref:Uncharacterized protein n=1 Tax=Noctiluca scintillans TaxID=2966 RepID=A0A7S1FK93_NOCSC